MKRKLSIAFALLATILWSCPDLSAQILAWQFGTPASLGNEISYASTTTNGNLSISSLTRGTLNASALARAFSSTNYSAAGSKSNAISSGHYVQFTVNTNSGFTTSLSSLEYKVRRSGTGPNAFIWQYSVDGTNFFDIGSDVSYTLTTTDGDIQTPLSLSGIPALQNVASGTTITFRLYAWGASATGGTFAIGRTPTSTITNVLALFGTVASANSLTGGSLTFPATCVNSTNVQNISISGSGLNGSNVVLGPFSGFGFSTNPSGPFDPSMTFTYGGSTLSAGPIYVQYAPNTAGSNSGNIPLVGGGVTSSVPVTASANATPSVTLSSSINTACYGGNSGQATVSVTGGTPTFNYNWTPGNPPGDGTNSVTGLYSGTYTCSVSDANGCMGSTTVFIIQPAAINLSAFSQTNVSCFGGNDGAASVVPASGGSGGFNYNWTPGNPIGDGTTSVTGLSAMVYTCTVTDANSCTQALSFNITQPAAIIVTASSTPSPATVCAGGSVTLTAGGNAASYSWTDGTNTPTDGVAFIPTSSSTYTVTGTTAGCSSTATVAVTVNPIPSVGATSTPSPATVCVGGSVTLSGSGATSYTWTDGTNTQTDGVAFIPAASSTYTVTGTTAGCSSTATVAVTVNPIPTVTASSTPSPATVCAGGSVTLTGSGATTYSWTDGTNTPTDGVAFIPASSSTYTVTGTASGCSSTATVAVTVNPIPTVGATSTPSPATVCTGGSVTLTGSGNAASYSWTDGTNTPTDGVSFVPTASSTYTVTGTSTGCSSTATVAVTVNSFNPGSSVPVPEILYYKFDGTGTSLPNLASAPPVGTTTANIIGGGLTQGGVGQSGTGLVGSGASSTTNYLNTNWVTSLTGTAWSIAFWSSNIPSSTNTMYIFGDNTAGGFRCFSGGVAGANNWILRGPIFDIYINGGALMTPTHCAFVYDPLAGNTKAYLNGNLVSTVTQSAPTISGSGPFKVGAYSTNTGLALGGVLDEFRVYSHALTPAEVMALMNVTPSFSATATPNLVCPGSTVALSSTGGVGISSYSWNPGALSGNPVNAVVPSSTVYTVTATDNNGCIGATTVSVSTHPAVNVTASSIPSPATVCAGANVTLNGGGANSYIWTDGANTPTDGIAFVPASSSTYTVTGTDGNGCTGESTISVTVNTNPTVNATASATTTCINTSLTLTGSGTATSYTWTGGAGITDNEPFVVTNLGTTTYTVTGTDGTCSSTAQTTVTVNAASSTLASATSNQMQNQADDFSLSYYDASCNLIASVDDGVGGNILGLTTSTVNVDANAGVYNGQPYVRRWYQITPANNVGVSATVTLYIDQADFTNYNSTVAAPYLPMPTSGNNTDPNIANIRITKNTDAGLGNSPVVITPTVNWNGTYWELTFPVTGFSQFRVHSVNPFNAALPATITKFNGRKLNSSDMLEWTTASEQNNAYFNLQHSTNGEDFKTIAKVNSKAQNGNSQTELNYSFEHTTPSLGHNYYRLQQVDIDNQSSIYAKVVDLIWGANGSTVSIYPNPTQDVLNIDLYTTKVQNTTVKVMDMSGRVVKQIQARSEAGMNTLSVSLGELASGVYTVQVFDNDKLSHTGRVKKN